MFNEASMELAAKIRTILTTNNVKYQCNDMGKLEVGGGGTICKYIAQRGIDSIDIGTPVLNMHAPLEVCHIADLYMTYKAFDVFYKSKII
jgi:aspartyl aminopeptidase